MKTNFKLVQFLRLSLFLSILTSCSDVISDPDSSFIVRGKASTSAHASGGVVAGGFVGIIFPSKKGFYTGSFSTTSGIPNKVVTGDDGGFTYKIDLAAIANGKYHPIFVGVSDAAQTFTILSQIPFDKVVSGAQLSMDVDPITNAASQLICPGGVYPPPSGTYCYSDPSNTSADSKLMQKVINNSLAGPNLTLEPGAPPDWKAFLTALLNDASAFSQLQAIMNGAGLSSVGFTPAAIPGALATASKVTKPIVGTDDNVPPTTGGGTPTGTGTAGSGCVLKWNCGSSAQCAALFGSPTGTYPETSAASCNSFIQTSCSGGACQCVGCT